MQRVLRHVLGLAALAACIAPPAAAQTPPLDILMRQFEIVAFTSEFGGEHRFDRLIRWAGPLRIGLAGRNDAAYRPEVVAMAAQLARLSGLSIEVMSATDQRRPNVVMYFASYGPTGPPDWNAACTTRIYDRNFVIHRAEIVIAGDIARLRRHCIAEELTQALGLANDSALIAPSIFNDDADLQSLAPGDEIMVRVLHHPRLRPGMPRAEAMPVVRDLLLQTVWAQLTP